MVDLEKLKSGFWGGEYKVDYENEKGKSKKIATQFYFDEEGIKIAIKRALGDFTDRTEKLKPNSGYKRFGVEEKFKVLCGTDGKEYNEPKDGSFVQKFIVFFEKSDNKNNATQDAFDAWHKEMCENFLAVIGPKYLDGLKYGKAQKIVNMTFKNAYCLKHDEISECGFEKYFKHCHMPLDSITLEWFKRTQTWLKDYCKKDHSKGSCDFLCKYLPESWSNIESDTDSGNRYSYETIQKKIRDYLKEYAAENIATKYLNDYTPLQAEFFVWKYMQLELAAEGVYNQFLSFEDLDNTKRQTKKAEYRNKTINEKIADLQEKLNNENIEIYKVQE